MCATLGVAEGIVTSRPRGCRLIVGNTTLLTVVLRCGLRPWQRDEDSSEFLSSLMYPTAGVDSGWNLDSLLML